MESKQKVVREITQQESKIIDLVRTLNFGEVRIIVNANVPVRIEEIKKSIQL